MADPLVDPDDVETVLLRSLTAQEIDFVVSLCEQASVKLRTARPRVDAQIAAGTLAYETVAGMLAGVIAQFLVNPSGASSTSETVGPVSKSATYSSNGVLFGRGGQLVITAADLAQLGPISTFTMPGTIKTAPVFGYGRVLDCEA